LNIQLEVEKELFKVLKCRNNLEVGQVANESIKVWHQLIGTLEAGLKLLEVVVTNHTVQKASSEIWDSFNIKFNFLISFYWPDGNSEQSGQFFSSSVIHARAPVGFELCDVLINVSLV